MNASQSSVYKEGGQCRGKIFSLFPGETASKPSKAFGLSLNRLTAGGREVAANDPWELDPQLVMTVQTQNLTFIIYKFLSAQQKNITTNKMISMFL